MIRTCPLHPLRPVLSEHPATRETLDSDGAVVSIRHIYVSRLACGHEAIGGAPAKQRRCTLCPCYRLGERDEERERLQARKTLRRRIATAPSRERREELRKMRILRALRGAA
jgi:hypothetical protein